MAASVHIDLTEEIEQDLKGAYEKFCGDVRDKLSKMYADLEKVCSDTHYKPMIDTVNETFEKFNGEIHNLAESAFNAWLEGEGSFHAAIINSEGGEDAEAEAKSFEGEIQDLFNDFWNARLEPLNIDTSHPKVETKDFETLEEIYKKASEETGTIGENAIGKINEKGEDDPTYKVILPAFISIANSVKNAFAQFGEKIKKAKEDSEKKMNKQSQNNDTAKEAITNTTATAEDIAQGLSMFNNI